MSKRNKKNKHKWGGFMTYEGLSPREVGFCYMQIIPGKKKTVLLASELTNNPGPRVADSPHSIWCSLFAKELSSGISTEWALMVEHYSDNTILGCGCDHYTRVDLGADGKTHRKRLSKEEIADLAGIYANDLAVDESILCIDPNIIEIPTYNNSQVVH